MVIPKVWKKRARGMKLNSFGMKSHPKRYENTLIEGMKLHSKGMKWCRRYEKIPIIPRYETDAQGMKQMHKVWNRCTRYEKCAQGIKQLHKGMKCFFKVWNKCFLEKQWFFIPLWVCFIPFWVWKYRLFFPDERVCHVLRLERARQRLLPPL